MTSHVNFPLGFIKLIKSNQIIIIILTIIIIILITEAWFIMPTMPYVFICV